MIIGLAGTLASGKGTVVEYLKGRGFSHYSSSDILKEILDERGHPHTRDYLSSLAEELLDKHPGGVLSISLEKAKKDGAENFVLEAIHRVSEADFVRRVGGKILGVDADLKVRYERGIERGEGQKDQVTFEEFVEHVQREEEGKRNLTSNIRTVIENADGVVMNNGTLEDLYKQVDEILIKIGEK